MDRKKEFAMKLLWIVLTIWSLRLSVAADVREWTDPNGNRFEGTFDKELFGDILIRDTKGRGRFIPVDQLSKDDVDYIYYNVPPKMEIGVKIQTRLLPKTDWSREDEDTTMYSFSVTVKKTSKLPHKGLLTAELFVLAKERAVADSTRCVLMTRSASTFSFPLKNLSSYSFDVSEVPFLAYQASWVAVQGAMNRGKSYSGYILSVSDSAGRLIAYQADISGFDWLTEDIAHTVNELRTLYQENRGSFHGRHFDDFFSRIEPPSIPWFSRNPPWE